MNITFRAQISKIDTFLMICTQWHTNHQKDGSAEHLAFWEPTDVRPRASWQWTVIKGQSAANQRATAANRWLSCPPLICSSVSRGRTRKGKWPFINPAHSHLVKPILTLRHTSWFDAGVTCEPSPLDGGMRGTATSRFRERRLFVMEGCS